MLRFSFFIFLSLLCFNPEAKAGRDAIYDSKVAVDVTAANASLARARAMDEANRRAFLSVAKRITTEEGVEKLAKLNTEQIVNFIKETDVIDEKASDVRYIATLKFSINGNLLREYMQEQNIPVVFASKANAVVIPVYKADGITPPILWEKENTWRKAWEIRPYKADLITFAPIKSDATNYSALDANRAITLDGLAFDTVAQNVDTQDLYVAYAQNNGLDKLNVDIISYQDGQIGSFEITGNIIDDMSFEEAVQKSIEIIKDSLQKKNIAQSNAKSEIDILYKYNSLREWLELEQKLQDIRYVEKLDIGAMGNGKVQFKIHYLGGMDNLARALREMSLALNKNGSIYLLENL